MLFRSAYDLAVNELIPLKPGLCEIPKDKDGRDGSHRLSSSFTEWMMGLPENWVCDSDISRTDELKLCGNGVVPQQAAYALRYLLDGINLEDTND